MDSPTVPPIPYTEKIGFYRVHRTLVSTGPERPISGSSEDAGVGLRSDAGSLSDRTLAGCVRSVLTYADVGHTEETLSDRTLGESSRA